MNTRYLLVILVAALLPLLSTAQQRPDTPRKPSGSDTARTLQAAVVTATRPIVRREIDRLIYDLQADPDSKHSSVLEMMNKVPYLSLDPDGNLLLKGNSSFKILVNGKNSGLLSRSPNEILRTMPASTIERIEVITTPPARYDAEGLTGIINIITVKKIDNGYTGTANASERGPVGGPRAGFSFTVKQDKIGASAWGGANRSITPATDFTTTRHTFGTNVSDLDQQGSRRSDNNSSFGGIELSYAPDSLQLLYGRLGYNDNHSSGSFHQTSMLTSQGSPLQAYDLDGNNSGHSSDIDAAVNYQLSSRKNKSRIFTLSYEYDTYHNTQTSATDLFDELNYPIPDYRQHNLTQSREQTVQADFAESVKGWNIETGVKGIFRSNNSDFQYWQADSLSGKYTIVPGQTNQFHNEQDVYGAYASLQRSTKKWDYKAGVRAEGTVMDADFFSTGTKVNQHYFNIIPSVGISRKIGTTSTINLAFSQRIKRPGINRLNPYVDRSNPDFEKTGNPHLAPTVMNMIQLGYGFSGKISLNVSTDFSFSNSIDVQTTVFDPVRKVTVTTYQNAGKARRWGFDCNLGVPITPKWRASLNGNLAYFDVTGQVGDGVVHVKKAIYRTNLSTYYQFKKGWQTSASLNITSSGPTDLQTETRGFAGYSFGINKNLFKDKLTLSASVNNPFAQYRQNPTISFGPEFNGLTVVHEYFRSFNVSVNYRFGKQKLSIRKNKNGIDNNDLSN